MILSPVKSRKAKEHDDGNASEEVVIARCPLVLPVGIVAVWQLASSVGWLSTRILPSPEGVVTAFWTLSASGELWQHLAISSWRALIGFSIGGSLGLILGLISGLSRWGERLLDTSIQMLRNVPHLALIPLVILWFGIDESAKSFWWRSVRYSPFISTPGMASVISIAGWWKWRVAMDYPAYRCLSM